MSTANAKPDSQELQDLKARLKMLEEKRDKRIPTWSADAQRDAKPRVDEQIAEVKAAIKELSK